MWNILKADLDSVNIENIINDKINPASEETVQALPQSFNDESIWLLRRMVKLLESHGTVDAANRQRVAVENIPTILGGYTVTAAQANIPTGLAPYQNPSTSYFLQTWAGPVDPRWTNIEQARISYNQIRNNLSFT